MKYKIIIILLFILLFPSCTNPTGNSNLHPLAGTWEMTEIKITIGEQVTIVNSDDQNYEIITFNDDKTFVYVSKAYGMDESGNGTWSTNEGELTAVYLEETVIWDYSISGNNLFLYTIMNVNNVTMLVEETLIKQ